MGKESLFYFYLVSVSNCLFLGGESGAVLALFLSPISRDILKGRAPNGLHSYLKPILVTQDSS